MNCAEARERLLEADLAELRGEVNSDLKWHVETCDECRALAERIVQQEAALAAVVGAMPSRVDPAVVFARRWRRSMWAKMIPLAAAAGLAAIVVMRSGQDFPEQQSSLIRSPVQVALPVVESASGDVAVFNTANPDIVVVWLLGGAE